jgi:hypothetical protein
MLKMPAFIAFFFSELPDFPAAKTHNKTKSEQHFNWAEP